MIDFPHLKKLPEGKELIRLINYILLKAQRPANEVILDDEDVMKTLKISKRKLQYLKSAGVIPYHLVGVRSYYLLSDILHILKENRIDGQNDLRI